MIFNGENILEYDKVRLKRLRSDMQIIFQDPYASLNPRMTVSQAIAAPLLIQGVYTANPEKSAGNDGCGGPGPPPDQLLPP